MVSALGALWDTFERPPQRPWTDFFSRAKQIRGASSALIKELKRKRDDSSDDEEDFGTGNLSGAAKKGVFGGGAA